MISRGKIAVIHVAKHKLNLDAVEYSDLLAVGGVTTSSDLNETGFRKVMDRLRELGFESRYGYRYKTAGGASIRQIDKIKYLWRDITGHSITTSDHRATLYTFLYKHNKELRCCESLIDMWNHLDPRTAHIMIQVLNGMLAKKRQEGPESPPGKNTPLCPPFDQAQDRPSKGGIETKAQPEGEMVQRKLIERTVNNG